MQNFESMFGFADFGTSKGKDHTKDNEEAVFKPTVQREFR